MSLPVLKKTHFSTGSDIYIHINENITTGLKYEIKSLSVKGSDL